MRGRATLGSFEDWAAVIGGILEVADVRGFLANRAQLLEEVNEEAHEAANFLRAWHQMHPKPIRAAELKPLCRTGGPLHDDLPTAVIEARDSGNALSSWLQQHRNRRHGCYQLIRHEKSGHGGRKKWSVLDRGA